MYRLLLLTLAILVLVGVYATRSAPSDAREVVVYSARIEKLIKPMFDAFTTKTGITVKYFTASESELFERLKAEGPHTPADILMTVDAGNLWLAQQAGLLGRFKSDVIERNIPAH
ncbi:MAG: substrate-binding domain-containing protein, partial [Anaerolineae bacterium]